jgi:nicotinate-nucleotide pyrophosphorylase (carboxylating)
MADTLDPAAYQELVRRALVEDVGDGDVTTAAIVPDRLRGVGLFLARRTCVVAGLDVAHAVFAALDPAVTLAVFKQDGEVCEADEPIARVEGTAAALLTGERTALNFLQHLSGIATETRRYVDAASGRLVVLDTRKTMPAFRALAKYAVRCGGGANHRFGLFDAVLIKDNHIRIAGGVAEAVARVRAAGLTGPIEVEAQSLDDVDRAIEARADVIMLDNLDNATMREALARIQGCARTEISGGVTLDRMPALAAIGADCVSIGALTHSAPAADISFEIEV